MRSRSVRTALGALVVAALATACSSEEGSSPAATAVPQASTTTTVGVDEVPDEITVDYAQRVMDALATSQGEMFRQFHAERQLSDEVRAWMRELSTEEVVADDEWWFGQFVETGFFNISDEPGDPVILVEELLHTAPDCLYLDVEHDIDAWLDLPTSEEDKQAYLALERRPAEEVPSPHNPTAWKISAVSAGAEAVEDNPCQG